MPINKGEFLFAESSTVSGRDLQVGDRSKPVGLEELKRKDLM
jgi:hypothetical protein